MKEKPKAKMVELDGRTGEGGGQLVRIAVGLSALTGIPIHIHHVRGNRPAKGGRGGGLKAQHASCVRWLADATKAETTGCFIGSSEFTFAPTLPASKLVNRNIQIDADSAASILLIFQAIFPFLLFAGDEDASPITVTIRGGTNVSYSLSYDYIDQVLLPSLELLGVPPVERRCESRGWSHGTRQIGSIRFKFTPLGPGESLRASNWPTATSPGPITRIDMTTVVPHDLRAAMKTRLAHELDRAFPGVATCVAIDEDSRHSARVYLLLVAHTAHGFRFGADWLYDKTTRNKRPDAIAAEVARKLVADLQAAVRSGGTVDEYLLDQLIVFQALASGRSKVSDCGDGTSYSGVVGGEREEEEKEEEEDEEENEEEDEEEEEEEVEEEEEKEDFFNRTHEPFGNGSLHARSAKWVVSQMLPDVKWLDRGAVCIGVGWKSEGSHEIVNGMGKLSLDDLGK